MDEDSRSVQCMYELGLIRTSCPLAMRGSRDCIFVFILCTPPAVATSVHNMDSCHAGYDA